MHYYIRKLQNWEGWLQLDEKMRWGILGCARIAVKSVIPAIAAAYNAEVLGLASRDPVRARKLAAELAIPRTYGSYTELLCDDDIQAVYIPLPNSLHVQWAVAAARRRKHVLCEKPMALNAGEGGEMAAAARENGVHLAEGFMYRWHPQYQRLRVMLAAGEIGEVKLVRIGFTIPFPADPGNIRYRREVGGGALLDLGCYGVNLARWIFGVEPVRVFASGKVDGARGVETLVTAVLEFPGEKSALLDFGMGLVRRQHLEVVGTGGSIELCRPFQPGCETARIICCGEAGRREEMVAGADQYRLMIESFTECIQAGASPAHSPEDSILNLRVLDACRSSLVSGIPVSLGGSAQ